MATYSLGQQYATVAVTNRLWHTVADMVHNGRVPNRAEADQFWGSRLSTNGVSDARTILANLPGMSSARAAGRGSTRGSFAGNDIAQQRSTTPPKALDSDGKDDRSKRASNQSTQEHLFIAVSLVEFKMGDSFSGRELDCRHEAMQGDTGGAAINIAGACLHTFHAGSPARGRLSCNLLLCAAVL